MQTKKRSKRAGRRPIQMKAGELASKGSESIKFILPTGYGPDGSFTRRTGSRRKWHVNLPRCRFRFRRFEWASNRTEFVFPFVAGNKMLSHRFPTIGV